MAKTTNNGSAKSVLANYLKLKNPKYALLITAPWGVGKTHFVEKETDYKKDDSILYVSLNGVANAGQFDWAIVRAIQPFTDGKVGMWGKHLKNFVSGIKVFGCSVDLNQVPFAEIVLTKIPDKLIFDDIERCTMPHSELSGLLNRFVEHENKRVVLIANSEKFEDVEKFNITREKLIGRTIHVTAESEVAILSFWASIKSAKAKDFLRSIQSEILQVFEETKYNNLRLLKQSLTETCEFFDKIDNKLLKKKSPLTNVALTYFALSMAFHSGEITIEDLANRGNYLLFSRDKGEKESKLHKIQSRHPGCDIQGYHNSCLPVDLITNSVGKGFASPQQINDALKATYHFAKLQETPDWIRLWNWYDETVSDLEKLLERIDNKLQGSEVIPAGEILQIYGAKIFMSRLGAIKETEAKLKKQFILTIKALTKNELITPYVPSSSLRGGYGYSTDVETISYGGYAFEISDNVSVVLETMKTAQDSLFEEQLPKYSKNLLKSLKTAPHKFVETLSYHSTGSSFAETPILHLLSETEVASELLKLFEQDRNITRDVCERLRERRKPHYNKLEPEIPWFEKLESELLKQAGKKSEIFRAQIALLISRHLDSA